MEVRLIPRRLLPLAFSGLAGLLAALIPPVLLLPRQIFHQGCQFLIAGDIDVLLSAKRVGPTGRACRLDMTDKMLNLARENQTEAFRVLKPGGRFAVSDVVTKGAMLLSLRVTTLAVPAMESLSDTLC